MSVGSSITRDDFPLIQLAVEYTTMDRVDGVLQPIRRMRMYESEGRVE